jgi:uncharacterized cupin superfamily protein
MHITRFANAPEYQAPNHDDMRCLRLQGHNAGPSEQMWMGMSHLLPGGGTSLDKSPFEKLYIVLAGEVTIISDTEEATLKLWDSVRIAPHEGRQLANRTNLPATLLLVMPTA